MLAASAMFAAVSGASASNLPNGGFDQGSLSGWGYRALQCSSLVKGSANASGVSLPAQWLVFGPSAFVGPEFGGQTFPDPEGSYATVFIQNSASWAILHRSFKVPRKARYLSLNLFWINQATGAVVGSLGRGFLAADYYRAPTGSRLGCPAAPDAQYARIDLLRKGASPRSLKKKDILATGWKTVPGRTYATSGGWVERRVSLKKFRGERVRLRVAVIETMDFLNLGLDSVTIR